MGTKWVISSSLFHSCLVSCPIIRSAKDGQWPKMLNKELIIGLFYCFGSMWYGFRILPFGILVFGILPFSISPFPILPIGILLLDVLLMSNLAFHRSSVSKLILFRIYQRYFMKSRTFLLRFCNSRFFKACARKDFCEKPKKSSRRQKSWTTCFVRMCHDWKGGRWKSPKLKSPNKQILNIKAMNWKNKPRKPS